MCSNVTGIQLSKLGRADALVLASLNILRARENSMVRYAAETGRLQRPERCPSCGRKVRIDGHQSDYRRPLDVDWCCVRCHAKRTRAIRSKAGESIGDAKRKPGFKGVPELMKGETA